MDCGGDSADSGVHWGGVGRIDSLKVKARLSSLSAQEEEFRFAGITHAK